MFLTGSRFVLSALVCAVKTFCNNYFSSSLLRINTDNIGIIATNSHIKNIQQFLFS